MVYECILPLSLQNLTTACEPIVTKPKPKVEPPKDDKPEDGKPEGEAPPSGEEAKMEEEKSFESATSDQPAATEDMDLD